MPTTSPNQRVVHIHREMLGGNFLGIKNDNWKYAARVLGAQAFLLYIYLVSNRDGFTLALSPAAIQQEIGMPRSTYHDQLRKLEAHGFLVYEDGKGWHFYEVPVSDTRIQTVRVSDAENKSNCPTAVNPCTGHVQDCPPEDIEININKINTINRARVDAPSCEEFVF